MEKVPKVWEAVLEMCVNEAENTYFSRGNADYEVEDIQEVQK
jgi:hypothetical protein